MNNIGTNRPSVRSPVGVVARSWSQRKLLWIPAVGLVLGFLGQLTARVSESLTNGIPGIPSPGASLSLPDSQLTKPVELSKVETVRVTTSLDSLQEMIADGKLPNVRSLSVYAEISPKDVRALAALPRLEALELLDTTGLSAADWNILSGSSSLRQLRIIEFRDVALAGEPIAWPRNLERVALEGSHEIPLGRLVELSQLPRLHTLAARFTPQRRDSDEVTSRLSKEVIACLRRFPALQRLYLFENEKVFPNLLTSTAHDLPHLAVRPWTYSARRISAAVSANVMLTAIFATVLAQLSAQFVGAQSTLIPGYRASHLRVASWIAGAVVLSQVSLLLSVQCHPLGVVGLLGLNLTFLWLFVRTMRFDPAFPGFVQPMLAWAAIVFAQVCVGNLIVGWSADADWLLRGALPLVSWALFAIGAFGIYDTAQWLAALPRALEARNRGGGGVPLKAFDLRAWRDWEMRSRSNSPAGWWNWAPGQQSRLERAISASPLKRRHWQLLAAGQQTIQWQRVAAVVLAIAIGIAVARQAGWPSNRGDVGPAQVHMLIMAFLCIAPIACLLDLTKLYHRRAEMAAELLRPMSRSTWVLAWFWIMCRRTLMYIAVSVLGAVVIANSLRSPLDPVALATRFGCVGACWLAICGVGMSCLTYRWGHLWIGLVGGVALMLTQLGAMLSAPGIFRVGTSSLATVTICLMLFGMASWYMAWRRWHRWEL